MGRWLLALFLLAVGAPSSMARDALTVIDDCVRQLDPSLDVGYQRIAARCPNLAPTLATSPWAAWLPRDWNQSSNELSADGLSELHTLLTRATSIAPVARPLRTDRIGALLATLAPKEPPRLGWWERFKSWLRGLLTPHPRPTDPGWLRRLFGDVGVPQAVLTGIVWAALAMVIVLAGAIVANEARVAGLLGRMRGRSAYGSGAGAAATPSVASQDLEHASLSQQPRLLLELIAMRLGEQGRLPPARALTVSELVRAARVSDAADRARLQALGAACEWVRFSDREVPPRTLAEALARGRELLAALQAPVQQAQSA